jgi:hypothetical protein
METLLTGAVNRLLRRFIKSAGGEVTLDACCKAHTQAYS